MPLYLYRCPNKHEVTVLHGMTEIVKTFCPVCGELMWRRPQAQAIKRSCFIEPSPAVRRHLETLPQQREEYEKRKHHAG